MIFSTNMRYKLSIVIYDFFDLTCDKIDICDEFDENVKNKIIADLIVIVVYVICDDVKNVINDVTKNDKINVWINITIKSDIVKKYFVDDDDEIDAKNETKFDVNINIKILNLIFLIWCSSICLWNWILLKYLIEQRRHANVFVCVFVSICFLIIRIFSICLSRCCIFRINFVNCFW